ncbi:MAG: tetrathionate reductase family octaheme c-type cytochrome [Bacteroidetes bacterium]|nr:tetrathionate reductase family octaheme c-type cytochrome [Bacteroidota bacterium]
MKNILTIFFTLFLFVSGYSQEDHSEIFDAPFSSPQEVTETCLSCHEGVDADIMKTRHWNWLGDEFVDKNGKTMILGKRNIINNFCIAVPSNWPRCTSCHVGYGWKDDTFDFTDGNNIDCLICHDQTGTYKKVPTGAGMPDPSVDLLKVAQSVGKTRIENCSVCHFNGGGGTGIKHGDMDGSMIHPTEDLDVHMGGLGFTCSTCHAGENHKILGASHGSLMAGTNHISCEGCHKEKPHKNKTLNDHMSAIACETCHIPDFAREEPTKTWWDWSTSGQDKQVELDEYGMPIYDMKKGDFEWGKKVIPEYRWHNGQADYYQFGEKIGHTKVVELNKLAGDIKDSKSKITPFKLMRGKQIYDAENDYLIVPKLYGEGGYWKTYDWNSASELGMQSIELAYSGKYDFIETEMYWPINHMVPPAEKALRCTDCHTRKSSARLNWAKLGYEGDPMKKGGRFE